MHELTNRIIFLLISIVVSLDSVWAQVTDSKSPAFTLPKLEKITVENANQLRLLGSIESFDVLTNIADIAFNPSGTLIATTSYRDAKRLWNIQSGELLNSWHCPSTDEDFSDGIAFNHDGTLLAVNCGFNVRIWNVNDLVISRSGDPIKGLTEQNNDVFLGGVTFSSDGKLLASWTEGVDASLTIWNMQDDELMASFQNACCGKFSGDTTQFSYLRGNSVYLWDTVQRTNVDKFTVSGSISGVPAFNPQWTTIAVPNYDTEVALIDIVTHMTAYLTHKDNHSADSLAFSPDGNLLVSGSESYDMILWDASSKEMLFVVETAGATTIVFSPDQKLIVTGHEFAGGSPIKPLNLWGVPANENS